MEVEAYDGTDNLVPWCQLFTWHQTNYYAMDTVLCIDMIDSG